jgi:hypothetical protein
VVAEVEEGVVGNMTFADVLKFKKLIEGQSNKTTNPFISSSPISTPKSNIVAPQSVQKPVTQPTAPVQQPSAFDTLKSRLTTNGENSVNRANSAVNTLNTSGQGQIDTINSGTDTLQNFLKGQIAPIQAQQKSTIARGKDTLAGIEQSGNKSIENTETSTGTDLLSLAQSKRETDAARQRLFAGLNTVDSFGNAGYTGNQENADSAFLNSQQSLIAKKEQNIADIRTLVLNSKNTTQDAIDKAVSEANTLINSITERMIGNETGRQQAIQKVKDDVANKVYGIVNEQSKYLDELGLKAAELDQKYGETNIQDQKAKAAADQQKKETVQLVDTLLSSKSLNTITGLSQISPLFAGTQGSLTKNYYDQLKASLSLEKRQLLKGSGSISDKETQMLSDAATALGRNLSEKDFRQVLNDIKTALSGNSSSSGSNDIIISNLKSAGFSDQEIQEYLGGQ